MNTEDDKSIYIITIICVIVLAMSLSYVVTNPNATNSAIKATDYPVTPNENMTVVQFN